jgi:hypothetical protein
MYVGGGVPPSTGWCWESQVSRASRSLLLLFLSSTTKRIDISSLRANTAVNGTRTPTLCVAREWIILPLIKGTDAPASVLHDPGGRNRYAVTNNFNLHGIKDSATFAAAGARSIVISK